MKFIYHHLGLGDHIICNGLVRRIINSDEEYKLFVKPHNLTSVSFMYQDLKNLNFLVGDDLFAEIYLLNKNINNIIKIGFSIGKDTQWDKNFYTQHNIDFSHRWDSFKINRDKKNEKKLYEFLNPKDEDFILIHSKGSDGIDRINYDKINKNYKQIFVSKYSENIFDYMLLIEKAKEIHCVESSFHLLVDSIETDSNLYFHTLNNKRNFTHKIKNNWLIV